MHRSMFDNNNLDACGLLQTVHIGGVSTKQVSSANKLFVYNTVDK